MERFTIYTEPVYGDSVARSSDLEWDINFKGFSDNIEYDLTKLEDTLDTHIFGDSGSSSRLNLVVGVSKYLPLYFHLAFELPISR